LSSTTAAARRVAPSRARAAKVRPKLVVVPTQRVVGRTPFVLLVGGLLLAGLLSLLMLHTLAAQDSFRQTSLQQQLGNLTDTEQRLEQQVQLDSAPAALRARARALGMVPSVITGYHQRPNGRTVAHEIAAPVVAAPVVTTTTKTTDTKTTDTQASNVKSADPKATGTKQHGHHGARQQ
jgi:cell division protein FtsB